MSKIAKKKCKNLGKNDRGSKFWQSRSGVIAVVGGGVIESGRGSKFGKMVGGHRKCKRGLRKR